MYISYNRREPFHAVELLKQVTEKVCPLVSRDNTGSAIEKWKCVQKVIQEFQEPIQCRFRERKQWLNYKYNASSRRPKRKIFVCLVIMIQPNWMNPFVGPTHKYAHYTDVPGGKVNILRGNSIGHSKQKYVYVHVSYVDCCFLYKDKDLSATSRIPNGFRDRAISL
jgi:hypothetical protein